MLWDIESPFVAIYFIVSFYSYYDKTTVLKETEGANPMVLMTKLVSNF